MYKKILAFTAVICLIGGTAVFAAEANAGGSKKETLPESQTDRFTVRLTMGYPNIESEIAMLRDRQGYNPLDLVRPAASAYDIMEMRNKVENVFRSDAILDYIVRLVNATREDSKITLGVSPRGALALSNMSAARAFLHKRDYVIPEDVSKTFIDVCSHRIILSAQAKMSDESCEDVLNGVLRRVDAPTVRG